MNYKNIILLFSILIFSLTCDETTLPKDCLGDEGGTAYLDECGVCDADSNNDNLFPPTIEATDTTELIIGCMDCTSEVGGTHWFDKCGICDSYTTYGGEPNYPYGICDCAGTPNGDDSSCFDECGIPNGDNSTCLDCAGVPNGDSIEDCAQICNGTSVIDSADECCEEDHLDQCAICNGDNSPYTGICDCASTPDGDAVVDNCGVCGGDNSTCTDCTGLLGGTSELDDCGICSNVNTGLEPNIDKDCFGTCTDESETRADEEWLIEHPCVESGMAWNESQESCKETGAVVDNCGACVDNISNGCVEDCQGVWGGPAICGCFINSADNYYCNTESGNCFGNGEDCNDDCLSNESAINPFIDQDIDSNEENLPFCNENPLLTIDECLCGVGNLISTPNNEFLGNCYYTGDFNLPGEICIECETGNTWNGGNIYNDATLCEYYGCTDVNATNYDETANLDDGNCTYDEASLSFGEITNSTIEIFMQNSESVGGFQFVLTGGTILSGDGSDGSADTNGLTVSTSSSTVLAFSFGDNSIPVGSGLLTILSATSISEPICIDNIVISDASGQNLEVSSDPVCSE